MLNSPRDTVGVHGLQRERRENVALKEKEGLKNRWRQERALCCERACDRKDPLRRLRRRGVEEPLPWRDAATPWT